MGILAVWLSAWQCLPSQSSPSYLKNSVSGSSAAQSNKCINGFQFAFYVTVRPSVRPARCGRRIRWLIDMLSCCAANCPSSECRPAIVADPQRRGKNASKRRCRRRRLCIRERAARRAQSSFGGKWVTRFLPHWHASTKERKGLRKCIRKSRRKATTPLQS